MNAIGPAALATMDSVTYLLADSRRLVRDLHGTVATTRPEIEDIVARLDTTTVLLTHFVRQVTRRPLRVLSGVKPPAGLEPPPPGEPVRAGSEADTVPELVEDTVPGGAVDPETDGGGGT